MNTPKQNEKNLYVMKKWLTEIVLGLSITWVGCWFIIDNTFYWVAVMSSVLFIHLLRFFKVSLKTLYVLCSISLSIAILVTILI
ncbi:hypothetical protein JOC75_000813 [Metabacillus crassostreae]|uniref:hypothetical protein n=1 Tax=Metabacillus crassostreae TaxID=929098 RepID=UPI001958AE9D|nr:hypothetical protein [Metabacillus crassostreae]MBM7602843.1 hypothetical protein [Metabacillus crassostreae]